MAETRQLDHWRGAFGDAYTARNDAGEEGVRNRTRAFARIWPSLAGAPPASILECGCNMGLNQHALRRICGADLYGVEPNAVARERALADGALEPGNLHDSILGQPLPFADESMDLVFTSGVLIHVPPEHLDAAYREMYRVSGRWILSIEYFAQKPETIRYHGESELLFKRDFGGHWLDLYPDLEPVDHGFFWKRTTGLDDPTWWLFRKH